jgi:hypothetical protein
MAEFDEHVKILIFALLGFMVIFAIAYSQDWQRLWVSLFIIILILFMAIAILARSNKVEIKQTD